MTGMPGSMDIAGPRGTPPCCLQSAMHGARFTKWCTRAPLSPKPLSTSTGRRRRGRARARHPRCGRLSGRSPRRGEKDLGPRSLPIPSRRARAAKGGPPTPWPDHWAFKNPKGVAYCRDHPSQQMPWIMRSGRMGGCVMPPQRSMCHRHAHTSK